MVYECERTFVLYTPRSTLPTTKVPKLYRRSERLKFRFLIFVDKFYLEHTKVALNRLTGSERGIYVYKQE